MERVSRPWVCYGRRTGRAARSGSALVTVGSGNGSRGSTGSGGSPIQAGPATPPSSSGSASGSSSEGKGTEGSDTGGAGGRASAGGIVGSAVGLGAAPRGAGSGSTCALRRLGLRSRRDCGGPVSRRRGDGDRRASSRRAASQAAVFGRRAGTCFACAAAATGAVTGTTAAVAGRRSALAGTFALTPRASAAAPTAPTARGARPNGSKRENRVASDRNARVTLLRRLELSSERRPRAEQQHLHGPTVESIAARSRRTRDPRSRAGEIPRAASSVNVASASAARLPPRATPRRRARHRRRRRAAPRAAGGATCGSAGA